MEDRRQLLIEEAVGWAERGFKVFPVFMPLRSGDDDRGFSLPKGWPQKASDDPQRVRRWFGGTKSLVGVAVLTGRRGGVSVIDVDVGGDKRGLESLEKLESELGSLGDPDVITGSGGRHYYLQFSALTKSTNVTNGLGEHIDLKGIGGEGGSFVFAPPTYIPGKSNHTAAYRYATDEKPVSDALRVPSREWSMHILKMDAESGGGRAGGRAKPPDHPDLSEIGKGEQADLLFDAGLWYRQRGTTEEAIRAYLRWVGEHSCKPPARPQKVAETVDSLMSVVSPFPDHAYGSGPIPPYPPQKVAGRTAKLLKDDSAGEGAQSDSSGAASPTRSKPTKPAKPAKPVKPKSKAASDSSGGGDGGGGGDGDIRLEKDRDGLKAAFAALGVRVRLNDRSGRQEWSFDGGPWEETDEDRDAVLRLDVEETFRNPKGGPYSWADNRWSLAIKAIAAENRVDPFREWLESLPTWDGTPRIDFMLQRVFAGVEDCPLNRQASRMLFLAAPQRTLKPGSRQETIVMLMSHQQGSGKSTFVRSLAGPLDEMFSDSLDISKGDKERHEQVGSAAVVEASELHGWNKSALENLKSFITRSAETFRSPYARTTKRRPRRWAMIGTSNDASPVPNDPSGNRRFLVVEVKRGDNGPPEVFMASPCNDDDDTWIEQCYAESLIAIRQGETANVPLELRSAQSERAALYRDADEVVESPLEDFLGRVGARRFKVVDAFNHVKKTDIRVTQARVSKALQNLGYQARKLRLSGEQSRWWFPIDSPVPDEAFEPNGSMDDDIF